MALAKAHEVQVSIKPLEVLTGLGRIKKNPLYPVNHVYLFADS